MMDAVKQGGNRQELHEEIRKLSMEAGATVKQKGLENNLLDLIAADDVFDVTREELESYMVPANYVGRSAEQTEAFLANVVAPILAANREELGVTAQINV